MVRYLILALALAFPVACQQSGEQSGTTEETPAVDAAAVEQQIRTNADAYEQAAIAGDVATLSGFYADDAILLPPGMAKAEGIDAVREAYTQMYSAGNPTSAELNAETIVVSESGDVAYEVGSFSFSGPGPDGTTMTETGKYIAVWKPTADGTWKIAADIWNSDATPGSTPGTGGAEGAATTTETTTY